jgi:hypothetical protein
MSRDWCFTAWEKPQFDEENVRYICWGLETCPTTDRKHYQGFAVFKRTCRVPKAKTWIGAGDKTHLEARRGTRVEARTYCLKDGDVYEWGEFEGVTKEQMFKFPINKLKREHPEFYCRYWRGLEKLQNKGPRWRQVSVTWLHGPAGCGKTRYAMEADEDDVFKLDRPYKWWDGYEGEGTLVLDDVDEKDFVENRGLFLNVLDGYGLRLETKGSHAYANWTHVYITSNWNPHVHLLKQEAWNRRVTTVTRLG